MTSEQTLAAAPDVRRRAAFYLAVSFVSGLVLMMVEIAGIRLLSPVFGDSQYTWSALIGVILLAASAGNTIGGLVADRPGADASLTATLGICAIATIALPTIGAVLRVWFGDLGLISGSLLFSLWLFTIPGVAFGMMSTISFRLYAALHGDQRLGLAQGLIGGAGLVGSVAGTFLTGFVLVRHMGLREIHVLGSAILVLFAVTSFVLHRHRVTLTGATAWGLAAVCALAAFVGVRLAPIEGTVFRTLSPYQLLTVVERPAEDGSIHRTMLHDTTVQGVVDARTGEVPRDFQRMVRLVELHREAIDQALFVGGGTFGAPQVLSRHFPTARSTVLEIDPTVIGVARDWFNLDAFPMIDAIEGDGRRHLRATNELYDLIYLDAYSGLLTVPSHLATAEFFAEVRDHLSEGGVGIMNAVGLIDASSSQFFDALHATVAAVFDDVHVYPLAPHEPGHPRNIFLVFGDDLGDPLASADDDPELARLSSHFLDPEILDGREAIVLTDDFAPIERLVSESLLR